MQNPYAVERFIQEHDAHALAMVELLALRRLAVAARRREIRAAWRERLSRLIRRPGEAGLARGPVEIPLAQARR